MERATCNAYRRGRETAQAMIHMVNDLVHPRDREPFMDAVRKEVSDWFRRRQEEKEKAKRVPERAPEEGNSSLRDINLSLKSKPPRRRRKSGQKT